MAEPPVSDLFQSHSITGPLRPDPTVDVVSAQHPPQSVVNRFMEAGYLRHPNLAGISATGLLEDRGLVYAIAEPVDHTLTGLISQRPLPADDTIELLDQLISALTYLHSENLVFCNLRPEAVWRSA